MLASRSPDLIDGEDISDDRPLASWLGITSYKPPSRDKEEDIELYLLRHTRLSPRNVIDALNRLAALKYAAKTEGSTVDIAMLVECVRDLGRDVARRMLVTASEELIARIPNLAKIMQGFGPDARTQGEYLINAVADNLQEFFQQIGVESYRHVEFVERLNTLLDELGFEIETDRERARLTSEVEGVLWRSGLVAYRDEKSSLWKYSWTDEEFGKERPKSHSVRIGFHSSLIDLCGLKVIEDEPIF